MANVRAFTGGRFLLVLDGSENLGFVKNIKGGNIKGEVAVATHSLGTDNTQKKHLATITHEAFIIDVDLSMSKGFYEWVRTSFDKRRIIKTGEFIACDFDYKAMSSREFIDAHISEVTIPALNGSSKDPAYMTVTIDPQSIRYKPGNGNVVKGNIADVAKKWLCSNFKFELGNLPCARVLKIDSFTWKQDINKAEVPNLKVEISTTDIGAWQDWHQAFVIEGKNDDGSELNGAITFMSPDMVGELGKIDLKQVGLISLESAEHVGRFTVELYVEEMGFQIS